MVKLACADRRVQGMKMERNFRRQARALFRDLITGRLLVHYPVAGDTYHPVSTVNLVVHTALCFWHVTDEHREQHFRCLLFHFDQERPSLEDVHRLSAALMRYKRQTWARVNRRSKIPEARPGLTLRGGFFVCRDHEAYLTLAAYTPAVPPALGAYFLEEAFGRCFCS